MRMGTFPRLLHSGVSCHILALMSLVEGELKHSWPLIRGESCALYVSTTEALCICV
jgi:hypothetical protein